MTKINLRIKAKPQAYLQTLTNTPAKYQKIKTVAFTRLDRRTGKNKISTNLDRGDIIRLKCNGLFSSIKGKLDFQ